MVRSFYSLLEGLSLDLSGRPLSRESVEYLRDYLTTWLEDPDNAAQYDNGQLPAISIKVPNEIQQSLGL